MLGFPQQAVIYSLFYVIFNEKVLAGGQGWLRMPALFAFLMFFASGPFPARAVHRLLLSDMCVWGGRDAADPEPGFGLGASLVQGDTGQRAPKGVQEHPKEPAGKSQVCEGRCPPWRALGEGSGWGLGGAGLDYGKAKEALWESEMWICLYCCFLSPSQEAGHESPRPQRCYFPRTGSQGHGERVHLVPVPISPPMRTPSSHPTHHAAR